MKRVISMVLCLMLVLGLATTASAATVVNDTTHAYSAYQIFKGSQTASDSALGSPDWGTGVNGAALLADLKANDDTKAYFPSTVTTVQDVIDVLSAESTPVAVIKHFAQLAYNNLTTTCESIAASATTVDLNPGYYLIVDVTEPATGDAKNPALLQITNAGPIYIQKKYDVPESEKHVIADDIGDSTEHSSKEDTPLGKQVEFHLKAEMPLNMEGYEEYTMTFHDDLSAGLTLDASSIQVFVSDLTTPIDASYYTVVTSSLTCVDNRGTASTDDDRVCDFHVEIPDVMVIPGYAPGCDVVVKYKATVNENALIIEYNNYRLQYSNDPNWDPDVPTPGNPPTGITPWKEVEVYHAEVEIRKVDGASDLPLTGAEFTLEGAENQITKVTKNEFVAYAADETVDPANKYWLLKDGTYTHLDPTAPEMDSTAYQEPLDKYYKMTGVTTEFQTTDATNKKVVATVGPDGVVKFSGLGEGTYKITETKAPDSYNGLKEFMTLTIVFHESTGIFEYSWTGGATGSGPSIQVDNLKGNVLPETGGIGTTLFYVVGGLLFAASAVLLVTKKRMTAE